MNVIDQANEAIKAIDMTIVGGTGWKAQAAKWASRFVYIKHHDYLFRVMSKTKAAKADVEMTVDQIVEYLGSLKLEDTIMSAIAMMSDTEKKLIVLLALMQLRRDNIEMQTKIPIVVLTDSNSYYLQWDPTLDQTSEKESKHGE